MQPNDTSSPDAKTCTQCGTTRSIEDFPTHHGGKRYAQCRLCRNADSRAWYHAHRERAAETNQRWNVENSDRKVAMVGRWRSKNIDRIRPVSRAGMAVQKAIKRGTLVRPDTCEVCGATGRKITAAHADYSRPLDVRWLCYPCHTAWDRADPKSLR